MSTPDSSQQYYLRLNGENVGPYFEEQIREMLRSGQVAPSELVWKEGMAEWLPCSTVFGEVNAAAPQPAPAAPVPPPLPQEVQYTVSRDGKEIGSFTEAAIRDMLKRGELPPHALVWKEGMAEWQPCSAVFKSSAQDIAQQVAQSAEVLSEKAGKALDACKTKWQDLSPKVQKAMGNKRLVKMGAIGAVAFVLLAVLGYCVLWPSETNFERELQRVQKAAENGKATAQNEMGVRAYVGLGIPEDERKCFQWFREAAQQGDALAQFNLGLIYVMGKGVSSDRDKASAWFKKSYKQYQKKAESGDAEAQYALSRFYHYGFGGVTKNEETAKKWMRKAAEQGHEIAQVTLCMMIENKRSAIAKLREYGKEGNPIAHVLSLGNMVQGEDDEIPSDKALDKELQTALHDLRRYSYGKLISCLDDLSITGDVLSGMVKIGMAYEKGEVLPQKESEAVKWYQLAAEIGFPPAMCELGECYLEGKGVSENTKKGLEWVRKAAELGSKYARQLFRRVEGRDYDEK